MTERRVDRARDALSAVVDERQVHALWRRVDLLDATPQNVRLALRGGRATFRVKPHGPRRWEIECGPLGVEVVGTVFSVARDAERAEVTVARGAVLVRGDRVPDHVQRLSAGQSLIVAPAAPAAPVPERSVGPDESVATPSAPADGESLGGGEPEREPAARMALPAPAPRRDAPSGAREEAAWREHLAAGRYREAYEQLGAAGFARETRRAGRVDELMRLADLARLSGHPRDAILPLERIVERHPHDLLDRDERAVFRLGARVGGENEQRREPWRSARDRSAAEVLRSSRSRILRHLAAPRSSAYQGREPTQPITSKAVGDLA